MPASPRTRRWRGRRARTSAATLETFREELGAIRKLELPREIHAALDEVGEALTDYVAMGTRLVEAGVADADGAKRQYPAFTASFTKLEEANEHVSELIDGAVEREGEAAQSRADLARSSILAAAGFGIVLVTVLGWLITRSIVVPMAALQAVMGRPCETRLVGRGAGPGAARRDRPDGEGGAGVQGSGRRALSACSTRPRTRAAEQARQEHEKRRLADEGCGRGPNAS